MGPKACNFWFYLAKHGFHWGVFSLSVVQLTSRWLAGEFRFDWLVASAWSDVRVLLPHRSRLSVNRPLGAAPDLSDVWMLSLSTTRERHISLIIDVGGLCSLPEGTSSLRHSCVGGYFSLPVAHQFSTDRVLVLRIRMLVLI